MHGRRTGVMVVAAGLALYAQEDARAQEPPMVRTISGKVYEGEHLGLVDSSSPLYTLSVTTQKGPGLDRMQVVDLRNTSRHRRARLRRQARATASSRRVRRTNSARA
jgi:hypothetical protein